MLESGVHLRAVSELLGHLGTRINAEVYAHLPTPTARRTLEGLSTGLGLDVVPATDEPANEVPTPLAYEVGVRQQEGPVQEAGPGL